MPRFDRTGPEGKGPRTGRGLGDCPPSEKETDNNTFPRRGRGFGWGRGRGRGFRFWRRNTGTGDE